MKVEKTTNPEGCIAYTCRLMELHRTAIARRNVKIYGVMTS